MTTQKETIDQTRRRLASPEWRRQEREGHVVGVMLLLLPLLLRTALSAAELRLAALMVSAVPFVAVPAVLWRAGPRFGFDRRAAAIVAIPLLGAFVYVALAWRLGHHRSRTWTKQEPAWGPGVWFAAIVVGGASWAWIVIRTVSGPLARTLV